VPARPPRLGAQARVHGLITQLGGRHDLTAVTLVNEQFDAEECRQAMQAFCCDVVGAAGASNGDKSTEVAYVVNTIAAPRDSSNTRAPSGRSKTSSSRPESVRTVPCTCRDLQPRSNRIMNQA
jgi:hypothetical protein